MKKRIYFVFGLIFMGLGIVGYVFPVMPGTIFMILAAMCFLKSSDKFYNKIVNNPSYGEPVRLYVEDGFISKKSKILILGSMWIASLFTILYFKPHIYLTLITLLMSSAGSFVVLKAKH